MELKTKGQAELAMTIATLAIVLSQIAKYYRETKIVVTIVLGALTTNLSTGLTGQALAAYISPVCTVGSAKQRNNICLDRNTANSCRYNHRRWHGSSESSYESGLIRAQNCHDDVPQGMKVVNAIAICYGQ